MKNWIRLLYVRFYNEKRNEEIVVGKTTDDSQKPRITISGNKYLSPVKDNFSIKIYNLRYDELIKIMQHELLSVEIYAGYLDEQDFYNFNAKCIFRGGVINILNEKREWKDNVATFVCASNLVAKGQKWRCSISLASGMNLYSAVKYISDRAGISSDIDPSLRYQFLKQATIATSSPSSYLEKIEKSNNDFFTNTDGSSGSDLSFFSVSNRKQTPLNINPKKGMMIGEAPEITSNGLTWTSLPVENYSCGQLVKIDNSWINSSSGQDSLSGTISVPNSIYLNSQGLYYIYDLGYSLDNTTGSFQVRIHCWSRSLFENVTEGATSK